MLELVVCFASPCVALLIGVIFAPALLGNTAAGLLLGTGIVPSDAPAMLLAITGGCAGVYGILALVRTLLNPAASLPSRRLICLCLMSGVCASFLGSRYLFERDIQLFSFGLPLLATIHLIYLCRGTLFGFGANNTMEPTR